MAHNLVIIAEEMSGRELDTETMELENKIYNCLVHLGQSPCFHCLHLPLS